MSTVDIPPELHDKLKQVAWRERKPLRAVTQDIFERFLAWYEACHAEEKEVDTQDKL